MFKKLSLKVQLVCFATTPLLPTTGEQEESNNHRNLLTTQNSRQSTWLWPFPSPATVLPHTQEGPKIWQQQLLRWLLNVCVCVWTWSELCLTSAAWNHLFIFVHVFTLSSHANLSQPAPVLLLLLFSNQLMIPWCHTGVTQVLQAPSLVTVLYSVSLGPAHCSDLKQLHCFIIVILKQIEFIKVALFLLSSQNHNFLSTVDQLHTVSYKRQELNAQLFVLPCWNSFLFWDVCPEYFVA